MRHGLNSDHVERKQEKENDDEKQRWIPVRCKCCAEEPYCDFDFCLRWWH